MNPRDELAGKYLRDNNWDYQKYGDKRSDRSAYATMMNYEISGHLQEAFEAGYDAGRAQGQSAMEAVV